MQPDTRRIRREKKTVAVMLAMFCRDKHGSARGVLCPECRRLHEYAMQRIDKCPFRSAKPTCANCSIHCYRKAQKAAIKEVMRYAGPRMMLRHPILAIFHMIDGRRAAPELSRPSRPCACGDDPSAGT